MTQADDSGKPQITAHMSSDPASNRPYNKPKPGDGALAVMDRITFKPAPKPLRQAPSSYLSPQLIRQGANIVPHVLLLADSIRSARKRGRVIVTTRKSQHRPWNKVAPQNAEIPERWLSNVLRSPSMMPFVASLDETTAIVPIGRNGRLEPTPETEEDAWALLDELYRTHAGQGQGTPKTLLDQIDFAGKLSVQIGTAGRGKRMVLYPSSGDIMRSARIKQGSGIADSTLFWQVVQSSNEAGYLVSLLNAPALARAFSESRDSGRHFQLHPWRKVPIPQYDSEDESHLILAELCATAERTAYRTALDERRLRPKLGQVGLSKAVREALKREGVLDRIDEQAAKVLPEQAEGAKTKRSRNAKR